MKLLEVPNWDWHFWKRNNGLLVVICEHVEPESRCFFEDMLSALHQKIPFNSRFRDRWYPLSIKRTLHYVERATPEG